MTKTKSFTKKLLWRVKGEGRETLTIFESFEILKKYKIPLADYTLAKTANDAVKAAKKIGYPVVLKVISKKATHKTDVGGLMLNITSEKLTRAAFNKIKKNMKRLKVDFGGVVVQKMIDSGNSQEVIVGGKKDPQFGQTIAFGLGGVFVEVFEDITFRVVPIERKDAERMVKEIKGYKILSGYRGKKYDLSAIIKILLKVSKLLDENRNIAELDINPIIVLRKGAVAVDARIVVE